MRIWEVVHLVHVFFIDLTSLSLTMWYGKYTLLPPIGFFYPYESLLKTHITTDYYML